MVSDLSTRLTHMQADMSLLEMQKLKIIIIHAKVLAFKFIANILLTMVRMMMMITTKMVKKMFFS